MAAHQAPPSLGFSRQEHWSGVPFPSPMHESEKWKWSRSVVSDPQQPHELQPSRLLRPRLWHFRDWGLSLAKTAWSNCAVSNYRLVLWSFGRSGLGAIPCDSGRFHGYLVKNGFHVTFNIDDWSCEFLPSFAVSVFLILCSDLPFLFFVLLN